MPNVVVKALKKPRNSNSNGRFVKVTVATSPMTMLNSSPDCSPAPKKSSESMSSTMQEWRVLESKLAAPAKFELFPKII